jgi:hypothetical protein
MCFIYLFIYFFIFIIDVDNMVIIHKDSLAKFGFKQNCESRKNFRHPSYLWLPCMLEPNMVI